MGNNGLPSLAVDGGMSRRNPVAGHDSLKAELESLILSDLLPAEDVTPRMTMAADLAADLAAETAVRFMARHEKELRDNLSECQTEIRKLHRQQAGAGGWGACRGGW